MNIYKIRIDGYKNIVNTSINFEDITALIGLNNYGKSNVLDGIRFAKEFISVSKENKSKMMRFSGAKPMNIYTYGKDFEFEIEFGTNLNSKDILVNYMYSFQWFKDNKEYENCKVYKELLKVKENEKGKQFSTLVERIDNNAKYKSSETGRCDKIIKIDEEDLVINKLEILDNLYYHDIISELNNLKFDFNYFMNTKDAFDIFPFDLKGDVVYELNKESGMNISKIVYLLKKLHKDKYKLLIDSFLSLFKDIETIEATSMKLGIPKNIKLSDDLPISIPENIYKIVVKEKHKNQITEFKDLSNGTKRIFLLLTSAILADIQNISLIAFEELENCIHPYLFQQLLIILSGIIENSRIIVTSHSPYLIQYLDINKIYIGIPSTDGTAYFKKVKKSKQKSLINDAEAYNMSIGDYIFNLMVESFEDNSELCSYLDCE